MTDLQIRTLDGDFRYHGPEDQGTKDKLWLLGPDGCRHLFKRGRRNRHEGDPPWSHEDWTEVVSFHLGVMLGLPCAKYEFATFEGANGTLSRSFLREGEVLDGGNVLMRRHDDRYPEKPQRHNPLYTPGRAMACLHELRAALPDGAAAGAGLSAADYFAGYLLLDALVANQDRHHENWGMIFHNDSDDGRLAPSFDHASSFARIDEEKMRQRMKAPADHPTHSVAAYCRRARSWFFEDGRRLDTVAAFAVAAGGRPAAGRYWLQRLRRLDMRHLEGLIDGIPSRIMSATVKEFSCTMLHINRQRLLRAGGSQ